jgi:arginase
MAEFAVLSSPLHVGEPLPRDLTAEPHQRVQAAGVAQECRVVAEAVAAVVAGGRVPLLWSGDCVAPLGVVAGLQRAGIDPVVVWLDGHADFNTATTSPSGYLPGMTLALLVGRGDPGPLGGLGLRPVPEDRVVLGGARDLDPPEEAALATSAITRVAVEDLRELPDGPVFLHVDADVVDPGDLPGMRFPAAGGPPLGAVAAAMGRVAATGRLAAVSIGVTLRADMIQADAALTAAATLRAALTAPPAP